MGMARDPLADFSIDCVDGQLVLRPGPNLLPAAQTYLNSYLSRTQKYRNISRKSGEIRFSLYQPVINSPPGERSLYMRLRRKFRRERLPQAVTIGITKACQCNCNHCSADYHMSSRERELTDEEMCRAVRESVDLGATNLIFLGGEPLLRRGLEKILRSVDRNRAQAVLFTNGEFLSAERCRTLRDAGLSGVFISVDSHFAKDHDEQRGRPGLFARLRDGARNAKEAGLALALSTYLTGERLRAGVFEGMMELGRELQADEVTFFDAIPVGRMQSGQKCTFLDMDDRKLIESLTRTYRSLAPYPAVSPQSLLTSETGSGFCFAANTQFYLSSTGEMCPCDFTPLSIGRFPDESLTVLWEKMIHSPLYRRRSKTCRMQNPQFRRILIERIPGDAALPYPIVRMEESGSTALTRVPN